ncbi:hypothetical protein ACTGJ2_01320 [Streptococcus suis]
MVDISNLSKMTMIRLL